MWAVMSASEMCLRLLWGDHLDCINGGHGLKVRELDVLGHGELLVGADVVEGEAELVEGEARDGTEQGRGTVPAPITDRPRQSEISCRRRPAVCIDNRLPCHGSRGRIRSAGRQVGRPSIPPGRHGGVATHRGSPVGGVPAASGGRPAPPGWGGRQRFRLLRRPRHGPVRGESAIRRGGETVVVMEARFMGDNAYEDSDVSQS